MENAEHIFLLPEIVSIILANLRIEHWYLFRFVNKLFNSILKTRLKKFLIERDKIDHLHGGFLLCFYDKTQLVWLEYDRSINYFLNSDNTCNIFCSYDESAGLWKYERGDMMILHKINSVVNKLCKDPFSLFKMPTFTKTITEYKEFISVHENKFNNYKSLIPFSNGAFDPSSGKLVRSKPEEFYLAKTNFEYKKYHKKDDEVLDNYLNVMFPNACTLQLFLKTLWHGLNNMFSGIIFVIGECDINRQYFSFLFDILCQIPIIEKRTIIGKKLWGCDTREKPTSRIYLWAGDTIQNVITKNIHGSYICMHNTIINCENTLIDGDKIRALNIENIKQMAELLVWKVVHLFLHSKIEYITSNQPKNNISHENLCKAILIRGKRKGQLCNARVNKFSIYCSRHNNK